MHCLWSAWQHPNTAEVTYFWGSIFQPHQEVKEWDPLSRTPRHEGFGTAANCSCLVPHGHQTHPHRSSTSDTFCRESHGTRVMNDVLNAVCNHSAPWKNLKWLCPRGCIYNASLCWNYFSLSFDLIGIILLRGLWSGCLDASCWYKGRGGHMWPWRKKGGGRISPWHQHRYSLVDTTRGAASLIPATPKLYRHGVLWDMSVFTSAVKSDEICTLLPEVFSAN